MKPSIGRTVHYTSYGTPGGEYKSRCCAAIITDVAPEQLSEEAGTHLVRLRIFNPDGDFNSPWIGMGNAGGTWHWPERIEE